MQVCGKKDLNAIAVLSCHNNKHTTCRQPHLPRSAVPGQEDGPERAGECGRALPADRHRRQRAAQRRVHPAVPDHLHPGGRQLRHVLRAGRGSRRRGRGASCWGPCHAIVCWLPRSPRLLISVLTIKFGQLRKHELGVPVGGGSVGAVRPGAADDGGRHAARRVAVQLRPLLRGYRQAPGRPLCREPQAHAPPMLLMCLPRFAPRVKGP